MTDNDTTPPLAMFNPLEVTPADYGETIEQVRSIVEEYGKPALLDLRDPITGAHAPVLVDKNGPKAIAAAAFDGYLAAPRFRKGEARFTRIESLIEHINRFKDADSAVFADDDRTSPSITAVLNYHPAGPVASTGPRFGDHRSMFAFPLSDEWKAWTGANGAKMTMVDFATFIEERLPDVLHVIPDEDQLPEDLQKFVNLAGGPDMIATPLKLVELSRGLRINENSVVREAINLSSGEGEVTFQSEHTNELGQPLRVPSLFLIAIPIFQNGPLYRLAARLRYRKNTGITFWFDLWRADRAFDHAFSEACEFVRVETDLPLLFGRPE